MARTIMQVCLHAIVPALLWFFSFFIILHFEGKRLGLQPIPKEEIHPTRKVLKELYYFIPMFMQW